MDKAKWIGQLIGLASEACYYLTIGAMLALLLFTPATTAAH